MEKTIKNTARSTSLKQLYNQIVETNNAAIEELQFKIDDLSGNFLEKMHQMIQEDFNEKIDDAVGNYYFDDIIESGIDNYDMQYKIERAVDDYDFDDVVRDVINEYNFVSYDDEKVDILHIDTLQQLNSRIEDIDEEINYKIDNDIMQTILDLKKEIKELKKSTCTIWTENIKDFFNTGKTNIMNQCSIKKNQIVDFLNLYIRIK